MFRNLLAVAAHLASVAAPLLLSACATVHGVPLEMTVPATPRTTDFVSTGEIRSSIGTSAAFDAWHVRGPGVNLTRSPDGSWDGTAGPAMTGFHLDAKPGLLTGPGVSLSVEKMADGFVEVGGLFFQDRYWLRISQARLTGSTHGGRCSFDLKRVTPIMYVGDMACGMEIVRVSIEFHGDAARVEEPILPQAAIALVAVMP
jgi:hypothetical protein